MTADLLRDLARAKAAFQLRTVEMIIRGPTQGIEAFGGDANAAPSRSDESPVGVADAQNPAVEEQSDAAR